MPVNVSKGNMYEWTTHTHTHLGGRCSHECSYCYVGDLLPRQYRKKEQSGRPAKYEGPIHLIEKEMRVLYDKKTLTREGGKYPATIFIDHCNDLWAEEVPSQAINLVMAQCALHPENTYVFQTKNPVRYFNHESVLPPRHVLGCTIETNRDIPQELSKAPHVIVRAAAMARLAMNHKTFITMEPIMDFDLDVVMVMLKRIRPDWINIGADSKGHKLKEPLPMKVVALIDAIRDAGLELREKHNLERLIGKTVPRALLSAVPSE